MKGQPLKRNGARFTNENKNYSSTAWAAVTEYDIDTASTDADQEIERKIMNQIERITRPTWECLSAFSALGNQTF